MLVIQVHKVFKNAIEQTVTGQKDLFHTKFSLFIRPTLPKPKPQPAGDCLDHSWTYFLSLGLLWLFSWRPFTQLMCAIILKGS